MVQEERTGVIKASQHIFQGLCISVIHKELNKIQYWTIQKWFYVTHASGAFTLHFRLIAWYQSKQNVFVFFMDTPQQLFKVLCALCELT